MAVTKKPRKGTNSRPRGSQVKTGNRAGQKTSLDAVQRLLIKGNTKPHTVGVKKPQRNEEVSA